MSGPGSGSGSVSVVVGVCDDMFGQLEGRFRRAVDDDASECAYFALSHPPDMTIHYFNLPLQYTSRPLDKTSFTNIPS